MGILNSKYHHENAKRFLKINVKEKL